LNILSLFSFTVFILFCLLGIYLLNLDKNKNLNRFAFLECLALGIWAFACAFFYVAPTLEDAIFWHRIATIGVCLFPVFAVHFFLILTNRNKLFKSNFYYLGFYALPILLLIKNIFGETTSFAIGFVQSTSGLGWTIVNEPSNMWTWVYLLYLGSYFGAGFYLLNQWRKESNYATEKKQALIIIIIDTVILAVGSVTDFVLPLFSHFLPPMTNIFTILFAAGFFILASKYQILSFSSIASSDSILDTIMDPVLLLDEHDKIIRCNKATYEMLGYEKNELINKEIKSLFTAHKDTEASLKKRLLENKNIKNHELDLINSKGKTINAILSASVAEDSIKGFMGIVVTFHDITLQKKTEKALLKSREQYKKTADELYVLANHDMLTHLPNRRLFFKILEEYSQRYHAESEDFSIIFMDLNGFKEINDTHGHDAGDLLLLEAAKRLKSSIKDNELLARIGGDEFTIILPHEKNKDAIKDRITKIKELFFDPFRIREFNCHVSISAGYSIFSSSDGNIDILLRNADLMMYQDKRNNNQF